MKELFWQPAPRADGRMEWTCPHGIGHGSHIHGCDGCCMRKDYPGGVFSVVFFSTGGTPYEEEAQGLKENLRGLSLYWESRVIKDRGSWALNTKRKPELLLDFLDGLSSSSYLLYVDVDARFRRVPKLNEVEGLEEWDIAFYWKTQGWRTGTILLRNGGGARTFLKRWIEACKESPPEWCDQRVLRWRGEEIRRGIKVGRLPQGWCKIFNEEWEEGEVQDLVIEHFQASRKHRIREES